MDLYLIRHSYAEALGALAYRDADRALTDSGKELLRLATPLMRARGVAPSVILTSPYLRARETAELLAEALRPLEGILVVPQLASGATPDALLDSAREHQPLGNVMVVGHNPEIDGAVRQLATRNERELLGMRPGTLAWFRHAGTLPEGAFVFEGQWHLDAWPAASP